MITYTEFSTFLFGQRLEVRTDPEGAEFYKVNYFPAARVIYICAAVSAGHMGTRGKITSAAVANPLARGRVSLGRARYNNGRATFFQLEQKRLLNF